MNPEENELETQGRNATAIIAAVVTIILAAGAIVGLIKGINYLIK
jgi:hypothetical protein